MKKILFCILILMTCLLVSCKEKKPKIYTGSVMLYSTLDNDVLKAIKLAFENEYRGVTLDYYHSRDERVRQLLDNEKSTGEFDGDVLLGFDLGTFAELDEKGYFSDYVSKESKKYDSQYKSKTGNYVGVLKISKEDDKVSVIPIALLKGAINDENGKLLVDYILSKKCNEELQKINVGTTRK